MAPKIVMQLVQLHQNEISFITGHVMKFTLKELDMSRSDREMYISAVTIDL